MSCDFTAVAGQISSPLGRLGVSIKALEVNPVRETSTITLVDILVFLQILTLIMNFDFS